MKVGQIRLCFCSVTSNRTIEKHSLFPVIGLNTRNTMSPEFCYKDNEYVTVKESPVKNHDIL